MQIKDLCRRYLFSFKVCTGPYMLFTDKKSPFLVKGYNNNDEIELPFLSVMIKITLNCKHQIIRASCLWVRLNLPWRRCLHW